MALNMRRHRGSRWRLLISATVVCALVTACSFGPSGDFEEILEPSALPHEVWGRADLRYSGRGTRVAVLGDDAIRGAESEVRRALAGYAVKVAAIRGEGFTPGQRASIEPSAAMSDIARLYADDGPSRVVVALGFNDLRPDGPDHQELMASAREVFDRFSQACVVGVTVPISEERKPVRARALNDLIRQRSSRVVDWNRMVRDQADLVGPDGVTPTPVGAEVLALAIRSSVETCV